jgi:hypothetical protein
MTNGNIKTFVSFVAETIGEKDTFLGPKFKFPRVIRSEMGPASTPENLEPSVVRFGVEQFLKWR